MLSRSSVTLKPSVSLLLKNSIRFQSTNHFQNNSLLNKVNHEVKSEPLPQVDQQQPISTLSEESFSVFPSINDVQIEQLVGASNFGKKTYFVERSTTGNLPVYLDYKNGNQVKTEIRRIHGDPIQLRNDLQERLPHIPKDSWKIIMQSKKIVIKGNVVADVKEVLSTTF